MIVTAINNIGDNETINNYTNSNNVNYKKCVCWGVGRDGVGYGVGWGGAVSLYIYFEWMIDDKLWKLQTVK